MKTVISPKKNRTEQRSYDENLYKVRHLVENAFLQLKRWRDIATRYAKNTASFLAAIHIRCIAVWANILRLKNDLFLLSEFFTRVARNKVLTT